MITVMLYIKKDCPACDQAKTDLDSLQQTVPHQIVIIDVETDEQMAKTYQNVPIVEVGPYRLVKEFSRQELHMTLGAARDRATRLSETDAGYHQRMDRGRIMTKTDRFSLWLSNHYMLLINLMVLLYVGLPFLAPVLMKTGATGPAKIIYTIYSPLCHQLSFRSFFLFGEQLYYPRELAGIPDMLTYEETMGHDTVDVLSARRFLGDEIVGYKVALCQRDIAIYGFILLFGIIFSVTGKKLKPIPWYVWVVVGLGPIALDGFSQLPGLMAILPDWFPIRESTPVLRVITGGLFGLMTAWYLYPMIEETMRDTRMVMTRKQNVIAQTQQSRDAE